MVPVKKQLLPTLRFLCIQAVGNAAPSFASTLLADASHTPNNEYIIKMASMAIYAGGTETVSRYWLIPLPEPGVYM
jgi:hypothetical protein